MRHIWAGMGIAIGFALWPVVVPAMGIAFLVSAFRRPAKAQQLQAPSESSAEPLLGDLMAQQMAIVHERNREHLENSFRNS